MVSGDAFVSSAAAADTGCRAGTYVGIPRTKKVIELNRKTLIWSCGYRFDRFGIISLQIDRERLEPAVLRHYHPSSVRWTLIQRFLDMKGSDYERVLMVDAGQTFFQGNPFDIIGDPGKSRPGLDDGCSHYQLPQTHSHIRS